MTDKSENLARVRAIRGGNRGVITKLSNEAEELCAVQPSDKGRLETIAHLLETKLKLIKALDEEVISTCEIEDIEREIEESDGIESRVLDIKRMIKEKTRPSGKQNDTVPSTNGNESQNDTVPSTNGNESQNDTVPSTSGIESQTNTVASTTGNTTQMAQMQNDNVNVSPTNGIQANYITSQHQNSNVTTPPLQDQAHGLTGMPFSASGNTMPVFTVPQTRTKLPKLVLPKFRGEITKWQTFWDSFNSSVHSSPYLTQIDKFNHLNSLLEGQALRAIQGLTLTNANYQSAVEILHQRFGKPQQIISTHMDELLKIPACTSDKASQLRFVYDKISINVRGLEALGVNSSQYGSLLIPVIMAKLPQEVRVQVARNTAEDVWDISDIVDVIRKEVEAREISEGVKVNNANESPQRPKFPLRSTIPSAATLLAGAPPTRETRIQCVYCHENHYSASCQRVSDTPARMEILKRDRRCFVCLRSGHRSNQCVTKRSCRRCRGNHHQSICNQHFEPTRPRESPYQPQATIQAARVQNTTHSTVAQAESGVTNETSTITASAKSKGSVLLQTATAVATNEDGSKSTNIKILFDSGSQRSYVTEGLKTRLGLKSTKTETLHLNTFGDGNYRKQKCEVLSLPLRDTNNDEIAAISVLSSPVICSPLNTIVEVSKYPHLQGLQLADSSKSQKSIDVLIGSDYYWDFITGDTVRGEFGPTAINSKFGWLVSGPTAKCVTNDDITVSNLIISGNCSNMYETSQDPLVDTLKQFWETETIGIEHSAPKELPSVIPVPRNDIERKGQMYEVGLPWKEDFMPSSDNYGMCTSRLRSLHYKLRKEPELLSEYDRIIQEQQKAGIIEKVSRDNDGQDNGNIKGIHYSPHHAVIRKDRETTKVRIVYDGSAKASKDNLSLNDCLDVGPNCIPHVFDMLAKFRCNSIGLTADIEKAFLMVGIKSEHRDMLRFLWFENPNSKTPDVVQYKFNRLVFGLRPSPSILGTTIAHHLNLYKQSEPEMAELLEKSLYVDDLIAGAEDETKAFNIYQKSKKIMYEGGFNLRKWNSNSRSLLEKFAKFEGKQANITDVNTDLSEDDNFHANSVATNANIKLSEDDESYAKTTTGLGNSDAKEENIVKVLGVNWNTLTDNFFFDFYDLRNYAISLPASKRSVLKVTAKVFDPLGFLTPVTVNMKILFQELCIDKAHWDEDLKGDTLRTWNNMLEELKFIRSVRIPRCYFESRPVEIQLHAFSDASERAYAAVVYLRSSYEDGRIVVRLASSKSRVAPLKRQTIPRLELLGAVIQARLVDKFTSATGREIRTVHWTDSMATLCWIKNIRVWKQYVQHRISEIHSLTSRETWRHCPGKLNPADMPSRGVSAKELADNSVWWNGPEFLYRPESEWPQIQSTQAEDEFIALREAIKHPYPVTHALANSVQTQTGISQIMDASRYSTLKKLLRSTAYVLRFARKSKEKHGTPLTAEEIRHAEELWIKSIQLNSFPEEIRYLRCDTNTTTPILVRQFSLYLDEGILRCKGRVQHSTLAQESKTPILLPTHHHVVELIIADNHERTIHSGLNSTLAKTRQRYWIVRGRQAVKKVVRRCVICKKLEGQPYPLPRAPDLPEQRVSDDPPFTHTGVDFAGPIYTKDTIATDKGENKAYVCLFTCASTRAVHLELTRKLSAEAFLMAFRRFTSRRGLPVTLISDNAKTFKNAANQVATIKRSSDVQSYLVNKGVTWSFIVEKAPWWGGFWERMVRTVKRALRKAIGRNSLTFEQLNTILIEIEAVVNARPLTYVQDDTCGISYTLTPSHLINGRRLGETPNSRHFEIVSTYETLTRKANYQKRLLSQFTNTWKQDYLLNLREAHAANSRKDATPDISVGDVVVLQKDSTKRVLWKLAVVEKLITGSDGQVRAAVVKVGCSDSQPKRLTRSVRHLFPIEVRAQTNSPSNDNDEHQVPDSPSASDATRLSTNRRSAAVAGEFRRRQLNIV